MDIEAKLVAVLDQEIAVKKGGVQSVFPAASVVLDSGQSVLVTAEAARQIRTWKEGSTIRVSGVGEPLTVIECVD